MFTSCLLAILSIFLTACDQSTISQHWVGPKVLSVVMQNDVANVDPKAIEVHTKHYTIYSTMTDRPDFVNRTGQLMEGAFGVYLTLAPGVAPTDYPMNCYLFSDRVQWMDFTRQKTGPDYATYLKISRGAYTIRDWCAAYYIGDISTFSVAAHEGWHQFCNREFRGHLPPFLEEGLACMFENVEWNDDLPRWNLSLNPARTLSLRRVIDAGELFPLDQLCTMHAGDVVNQSGIRIEAFYAQSWAFARYLWEGENGRFRPALQQIFKDTAAGTVADPTGTLRLKYLRWNPAGVKPMLEHYLGQDMATTTDGFLQFEKKIAYQEMSSQFELPN